MGVQLQKEEAKGGWARGVEEAGTRDRALSTDREGLVEVCNGRHDRVSGCVLNMQTARKHAQDKNGY